MKFILLIVFLFYQYPLNAQTNGAEPTKKKPSWSEAMPERPEPPNLNIGSSLDTTIKLDMGDYNLRQKEEINPDVEDMPEQSIESKEAEVVAELARLEQEQKAAQKLAEQKRLAALEKNREEQRQTQTQQEAERPRVAAQLFKQEQKKQVTNDEVTEENFADEAPVDNADITTGVTIATTPEPVVEAVPYQWQKIKNISPEYPIKATRGKKSGWVEIAIIIDSSGAVIDAQILTTYKDYTVFNKSALKAVKKWKYDPPNKYGIQSNQRKIVKIIFEY